MTQPFSDRLRRVISRMILPQRCLFCGLDSGQGYPVCDQCLEERLLAPSSRLTLFADNVVRCAKCGRPLISAAGICTTCREKGIFTYIDRVLPLFPYDATGQSLLALWKSRGMRGLSWPLARCLVSILASSGPVTLVPVPPRPNKIRSRGWDQVEELARLLDRHFGMSVSRCLMRRSSMEQKKLGKAARSLNIKGRIVVKDGVAVPEVAIVLDDLMTTGATLDACAEALKLAGCGKVYGLTLYYD